MLIYKEPLTSPDGYDLTGLPPFIGTYSWYLVPGMLAILHNSFPTSAITLTRKATMRWEWQSPT